MRIESSHAAAVDTDRDSGEPALPPHGGTQGPRDTDRDGVGDSLPPSSGGTPGDTDRDRIDVSVGG